MESPKFLRKYKWQINVFKYVVFIIATISVWNICADLVSCPDTLSCIFGTLMAVVFALFIITHIITDVKKLIK